MSKYVIYLTPKYWRLPRKHCCVHGKFGLEPCDLCDFTLAVRYKIGSTTLPAESVAAINTWLEK